MPMWILYFLSNCNNFCQIWTKPKTKNESEYNMCYVTVKKSTKEILSRCYYTKSQLTQNTYMRLYDYYALC